MRIVDTIIDRNGKQISLNDFVEDYYSYNLPNAKWHFENIRKKILKLKSKYKSKSQIKIIDYIVNNFEKLIKASPTLLHKTALLFNSKGYTKEFFCNNKRTSFGSAMLKTFNYESFRGTTKAFWFGESLNIKACLYCNAQYVISIRRDSTKIRSKKKLLYQFDHFYSKDRYPHLSLSMFNLIPCCSACNISKSKSNFTIKNAIHPYFEDINKSFQFIPNYSDVVKYFSNKSSRKIKIDLKILNKKFEYHDKIFSIKEIYECHTDVVEELYLKAHYYNSTRRKEVINKLKGIVDDNLIYRFILGNYHLDSDLNKRPLSKLAKDISKKIKLI